METTMVEMPKDFLPVWKNFEELSLSDRQTIIILINRLSRKEGAKEARSLASHETKQASPKRIFITPKINALEKGFKIPDDISDDYKKERGEIRAARFL